MSEKNKRNLERIYLHQFLDIIDQHTNKHLGYVSNFSMGGIMYITNRPIDIHDVKDIYIVNNIEDDPVTIKAKIEVRWIKADFNPQMTCVGCRFLEIDDDNKQLLDTTGRAYSFEWS
jgi:hypothetical protein